MTARILLVEDDPVSRDLLAALIAARGHTVETAEDGFGALRMAQEQRYDLVLVDYHLPEMDGYALARLMRSLGESTNPNLKMVAITADRFGLATRRGADAIFDSMLSKPIEPDTLFAFLDDCLGPPVSELDAFLAGPTTEDAQSAVDVLWRVRGIASPPAAAVFPDPKPAERASLDYCFDLVAPEQADCLVLLHQAGLAEVEAWRAKGATFLQPLLTLDETLAPLADVLFQVGDGDSWSAAAERITTFRTRRDELAAIVTQSADFDTRLAAYLYVSGRPLVLRRDELGRTVVPYTAGFAPARIIETVRRLATRGFVKATPATSSDDGRRELHVALTHPGCESLVPGQSTASA